MARHPLGFPSLFVLMSTAALLAACGADEPAISMDFSRPQFFAAPFPASDLAAGGAIDLSGYPGRSLGPSYGSLLASGRLDPQLAEALRDETALVSNLGFAEQALATLERDGQGFGLNGGVFFRVDLPDREDQPTLAEEIAARAGFEDLTDWNLPSREGSMRDDATVFLLNVDPSSPAYLRRVPVDVSYSRRSTQYRPSSLLSAVPHQGSPLAPGTLYAVFVRRAARSVGPLVPPPFMQDLVAGRRPADIDAAALADFRQGLAAIAEAGTSAGDIAGMTVFRTADPLPALRAAFETATRDGVELGAAPALVETHPGFCVYQTTVRMPVYQEGAPPYLVRGGGWVRDPESDDGALLLQRRADANVFITLPRSAAPAAGFPTAVFVRTGGGGDRPAIDRGVRDTEGEETEVAGGPARELALEGWATISVDGPHGGLRNVLDFDEQLLVFNFLNPIALRDNIRQSALEQALIPSLLDRLHIDASACPDLGPSTGRTTFDGEHIVLMGHSMGATIAPLAAVLESRYEALILSGAGASWIENILHKERPLPVKEVAEALVGYLPGELDRHDPILSVVQWAADAADPLNYNRYLLRDPARANSRPRHILMIQGMVDRYILPPIANAQSASLGLDAAGPLLDQGTREVARLETLSDSLRWSGRQHLSYPVTGNFDGTTAVVVQYPEDSVEDGHEVMFQTDAPKVQYRCFLRTLLDGAPMVVDPGMGCE